jgi:hemolysin III
MSVLMIRAAATNDPWRISGCAIFSAALVAVYAVSTTSHAVAQSGLRRFFRMLDQGLIYLLIVASYTPWSLAYLRTPAWWVFLALMWSLAIAGLVSKLVLAHRIDSVTLWSYLLIGWLVLIPMVALLYYLPWAAPGWVLAGGVFYTAGTVFHRWDNPSYHTHGIWHVFVIAGSVCHWLGILLYVVAEVPY